MRDAHVALIAAIRRFARRRKRWQVLHGAARAVLSGVAPLLAWCLADWAFGLPPWPLLIAFVAIVGVAAWAVAWHLVRPAARRLEVDREAIAIERLHGRLDNELIGALQLGRDAFARPPEPGTAGLVAELVRRAAVTAASLEPARLVDLRPARRAAAAAAVIAAATIALAVAAPGVARARVARLADAYAVALDALFPVTLAVEPGDVAVLRGSPVTLTVQVRGAHRRAVELLRLDGGGAPPRVEALELVDGRASMVIAAADADFAYRFRYGRRESASHRVRVGDRAELAAITYDLAYPAYTGVPSRTIVGRVPRIQALNATNVQVSLAVNTPLHPELSYVEWADGGRQPLVVTGRFASFAFTVDRADRATIRLCGALGAAFASAQPVELEVAVDRDRPPTIEPLLKTASLTMLADEAARFALGWRAEDDFGVAEVALEYRIDVIDPLLRREPRSGTLPVAIDPPRDRAKDVFAAPFAHLDPPLEPGDRITITLSAKDNNTESGPGVGRSAPIEIVVVRPDLSVFAQQNFGFDGDVALRGLRRVKRATDLLVDPDTVVRAEAVQPIERKQLSATAGREAFPTGSEEAVGDYFRLLSGEP